MEGRLRPALEWHDDPDLPCGYLDDEAPARARYRDAWSDALRRPIGCPSLPAVRVSGVWSLPGQSLP